MADSIIDEINPTGEPESADVNLEYLSEKEINAIRRERWRARTDLLYLCEKVLGKDLISKEFNGALINFLQKFPRPDKEQFRENDLWLGDGFRYKPIVPSPKDLKGARRRLVLDHRSSFKTTINCIGHTIQWLINYPGIAIAILQYNIDKAEALIRSIKENFLYNKRFRFLFPELCPPRDKLKDFGTKTAFDVWNIDKYRKTSRPENSVMAGSLERGMAGYHFEVLKLSDVVETQNTMTEEQCLKTIHLYGQIEYILVSPTWSWIDIEGTRYHFGDLYGKIIDDWKQDRISGRRPVFEIYCRGVYKKKLPYEEPRYSPDELDYDFLYQEDGKRIPWAWDSPKTKDWISREFLEAQERSDPDNFAAQMLNKPIGGRMGITDFPIIQDSGAPGGYKLPAITPLSVFRNQVDKAYTKVAVDTAETVSGRSDFTAIVSCVVDRFGVTHVFDIICGKFQPDETRNKIIAVCDLYKPEFLVLESIAFIRGLEVAIRREWDMFPHHHIPKIIFTKRYGAKAKEETIRGTLTTPYRTGDIRFVRELIGSEAWSRLIQELNEFPRGLNDDILDALSALFYDRDWFGKELAEAPPQHLLTWGRRPNEHLMNRILEERLGIGPITWGADNDTGRSAFPTPEALHEHYIKTG
ncbi:MAG: hypothetical protein V2G41_09560 [bacterium JZ-2024 1]